jgi:hypothetical protein
MSKEELSALLLRKTPKEMTKYERAEVCKYLAAEFGEYCPTITEARRVALLGEVAKNIDQPVLKLAEKLRISDYSIVKFRGMILPDGKTKLALKKMVKAGTANKQDAVRLSRLFLRHGGRRNVKVTPELAEKIVTLKDSGVTYRDMAPSLGVCENTCQVAVRKFRKERGN